MKFCVDVTKVCEFLGIDSEQFNSLTVSQLEEAKWGIQEAEIEARRNDEKIMDKYRYFFQAYDVFVSYFGQELTDKYLPVIPLEDFVEIEHVRQGMRVHGRPSQLIGHGDGCFPIRRGRGSRSGAKEYAPADIYEVSSNYQGLKHSEIIEAIFEEAYPWLEQFDLSIYELRHGEKFHEFYLETEMDNSLYVPYECFVNGDVEGILHRNEKYLSFFYPYGEKGKETYERLIKTPTVKKFLSFVEGIK